MRSIALVGFDDRPRRAGPAGSRSLIENIAAHNKVGIETSFSKDPHEQ